MNKDFGINELTKCSENSIDRVDGRNLCARPNGFEVEELVTKLLVVFVVIAPRSDAGRVEIIGTDPDAGIVDDVVIRLPLFGFLGLSEGIVKTEGGSDEKLNVAFGLSEFEYEHDSGWPNSACACSCAIRAVLSVVDI